MRLHVPICPECHHRGSMRAGDPAYCYCKCHDAADLALDLLVVAREALAFLDVLVPCHPTTDLLGLQMRLREQVRAIEDQPPY